MTENTHHKFFHKPNEYTNFSLKLNTLQMMIQFPAKILKKVQKFN